MTGPLRDLTALRADAELLRGTFRSSEAGMDRIEAYDRLWRDLPALIDAYERAEATVARARAQAERWKHTPDRKRAAAELLAELDQPARPPEQSGGIPNDAITRADTTSAKERR